MTLRWSDPIDRVVLEDLYLERGWRRPALPPYFDIGDGYGDGNVGDGNGDGDGDGYGNGGYGGGYGGDGGDGYGNGGYGDGYGGDGGDGYGGDDGDGEGEGGGDGTPKQWEAEQMIHGLTIVCTPSGYSPFVRVGWCRRLDGDEWEMIGARVIRRFGRGKSLSELANNGPADDTQLLPASSRAEPVHRLHAVRVIPADEASWAKDCPRPEGWTS